MKFTEEQLKEMREEVKKLVEVAEEIERKYTEATDRIMDKMKETGFIS
jgi:ribosomal protein S13